LPAPPKQPLRLRRPDGWQAIRDRMLGGGGRLWFRSFSVNGLPPEAGAPGPPQRFFSDQDELRPVFRAYLAQLMHWVA
jgi:hypothetical protein